MDQRTRDTMATPKQYHVLYRIVRCLDCAQIPYRDDNDCTSLMTTFSDVNEDVKAMIKILYAKKYTLADICNELKYVCGNHIIANRRDKFTRYQDDGSSLNPDFYARPSSKNPQEQQ